MMDWITNNKRKATMVLLQIEESLGKYILRCESGTGCLSGDFLNQIVERSKNKDEYKPNSMKNVLEETYLQEVFDIALNTTKGVFSIPCQHRIKL
ncbi:MAG: hypothetical protein COT46_03895 [Sulfurimonas sp. CG08_land_8_20_14_0_20_36_33]|nr:hypothetical protein [Campylobacterota bacterium]OIO17321.1 MAG: hypothetical protein AUJ81_02270 [Helicobacteraceae bacterium CG1_02_36_14]PIP10459.1 MAG: hypothetical protein COX50_05590 [Sulfurimonas sp. CG23_combo_of_CG06-09_8_20_14_all_36_33]PIS26088.1 MAG: hypothetical protein COT46_03895 [Sulfurimonas sp. CG08_land_8_20_14_0_20_36_33]PIU35975.1 MAG: hypothetical protein COT05_01085 [Sulfurimonas sp. CG07_land_8_20_14_0_80_36_56]PIV02777.1 MAG: hypothetical protein COS56_10665 [Sulfur